MPCIILGHDYRSLRQIPAPDINGCIQVAARIATEVQNKVPIIRLQKLSQGSAEKIGRIFGKCRELYDKYIVFAFRRCNDWDVDNVAHDTDVPRLVPPLPPYLH